MPTIKRYISNDGTEHSDVPTMRAHEIVKDVQLALTTTIEDVRAWLGGSVDAADKRDALLRIAVRVGKARPPEARRPRATKPKAASDAANGSGGPSSVDAGAASGGEDANNVAEPAISQAA